MSRAWLALADDCSEVTRLLIAFRDWLEEDQPSDESFATSVARLFADPATEFLLGGVEPGSPPCGVCQLRFRHSVWTDSPDCWLEDLYVEQPAHQHAERKAGGGEKGKPAATADQPRLVAARPAEDRAPRPRPASLAAHRALTEADAP